MTSYQTKIQEKLKEIIQAQHVKTHLGELNNQLAKERQTLGTLKNEVDQKLIDWETMQSKSIKSIFYKVLGSKEEQIEKERQEYLQVSLKYNEAIKSVELLEFEAGLLNKKLVNVKKMKSELEVLKKKREKEIIQVDPVLRKQLQELNQEVDQNYALGREVQEAREAGQAALRLLQEMVNQLGNAKKWGQWDMVNKGYYHKSQKYGAIDTAVKLSYSVKQKLHLFSVELSDIGKSGVKFNFDMGQFSNFGRVFFDNLISDWVVQQKIVNTLSNISSVRDKVILILQSVEGELNLINNKMIELQNSKDQILTS